MSEHHWQAGSSFSYEKESFIALSQPPLSVLCMSPFWRCLEPLRVNRWSTVQYFHMPGLSLLSSGPCCSLALSVRGTSLVICTWQVTNTSMSEIKAIKLCATSTWPTLKYELVQVLASYQKCFRFPQQLSYLEIFPPIYSSIHPTNI